MSNMVMPANPNTHIREVRGSSPLPPTISPRCVHCICIENQSTGNFYIGSSDDISNRLYEHNHGEVKSAKSFRPLKVVHTESYSCLFDTVVPL